MITFPKALKISSVVLPGLAVVLSGCGAGSSGGFTPPGGQQIAGVTVSTGSGGANAGSNDGATAAATYRNPVNVAQFGGNEIAIADFDNSRVRLLSGGQVTTIVNQPNFQRPFGLTYTPNGTLYVSTDRSDLNGTDPNAGTLWRIDKQQRTATVVARNLGRPRGIAALSDTQIVLSDMTRSDVRIINPTTGAVTFLAGGTSTPAYADGTGNAARFSRPYGVARNPVTGNIVLADQDNHVIRLITPGGSVTTIAGGGQQAGYVDGDRFTARFNRPQDVAVDSTGIIYVSDVGNSRIRRILVNGTVQTVAGTGIPGFQDGEGSVARFFGQEGLTVLPNGDVVVADGTGGDDGQLFNRLRLITISQGQNN